EVEQIPEEKREDEVGHRGRTQEAGEAPVFAVEHAARDKLQALNDLGLGLGHAIDNDLKNDQDQGQLRDGKAAKFSLQFVKPVHKSPLNTKRPQTAKVLYGAHLTKKHSARGET